MAAPLKAEIETERLLLRPLKAADAPAIQKIASDERVARFTASMPHPYPDGAAERFIAETAEKQARGETLRFAVTLRAEPATPIGVCGLERKEGNEVEIGYWLGVDHWGRGYASEAVRALAGHGQTLCPGKQIVAHTFPDNVASQRVLEKAGFERCGTGVCEAPARDCKRVEAAPRYVLPRAA